MALAMVGFPIRTSTDQSLGGNSPWLIATSNVLLRLQAPRHPPLALHSLEKKMLVLAMEFSRGSGALRSESIPSDEDTFRRYRSALLGATPPENGTEEARHQRSWSPEGLQGRLLDPNLRERPRPRVGD